MRVTIICAFLCSISCGPPDGLVVDKNGFTISDELLWNAIYFTEQNFNEFYNDNLNIDNLIEEEGLSIKFRPISEQNREEEERGIAGWYHYNNHMIEVFVPPEPQGEDAQNWEFVFDNCYWKYFPITHELLHFIAHKYLDWDGKPHMYPNMYAKWAEKNDLSIFDTVEGKCASLIIHMCVAEAGR